MPKERTEEQKEHKRQYMRERWRQMSEEEKTKKRAYIETWKKERMTAEQKERRRTWRRAYRKKRVENRYGLSPEQYDSMIAAAGGKCQICGRKFDNSRPHTKACIDHCHGTTIVRGVLCRSCNVAEGFLKTPENALRLYQYMMKNELFYQGGS